MDKEFELWFWREQHRLKYQRHSPVYLAAQESWQAAKSDSAEELQDYKDVLEDKRRLTRLLDIAMHGEEGAAKQASLCDLIPLAERMREQIATLTTQLDEVRKVTDVWQPIEMAPRDGRKVRLKGGSYISNCQLHGFKVEEDDQPFIAIWKNDYWKNCEEDLGINEPTHWAPVTPSPTALVAKGLSEDEAVEGIMFPVYEHAFAQSLGNRVTRRTIALRAVHRALIAAGVIKQGE